MTAATKPRTVNETVLKVFIRDIPRFIPDEFSKYHYHFCGLKFKAVQIHGVLTEVISTQGDGIRFQLSDPTGGVEVYYNSSIFIPIQKETLARISEKCKQMKEMNRGQKIREYLKTHWMEKEIEKACERITFKEGDCISVIGDLFEDYVTKARKVSACVCFKTSLTMDIVWLQQLLDLYRDKYKYKRPSASNESLHLDN